jgi:hypothetical protein
MRTVTPASVTSVVEVDPMQPFDNDVRSTRLDSSSFVFVGGVCV